MLKNNKKYHIFNPQILSGGGDTIRDVLGLSAVVKDNGEISLPSGLGNLQKSSLLNDYKFGNSSVSSEEISYTFKHVLRLFGDESKVKSDKHWLSYVFGGTFSEQQFPGIYTAGTFLDHQHTQEVPYTVLETKLNNTINTSAPDTISIKPFMKSYYSNYDSYVKSIDDTKQVPNIYEFLSQQADKNEKNIKEKLNVKLPTGQAEETLSSGELLQNVFVCSDDVYEDLDELNNFAHLVPSSNIFEMKFEDTGEIVSSIKDNGFSNRFMKVLKDCFSGEEEAPSVDMVPFSVLIKELGQTQEVENNSVSLDLKVLDIFEMMNYSLREYNTELPNFKFLLDDSELSNSQYNDNSIRRLEKTIPTVKQMRTISDFIKKPPFSQQILFQPLNTDSKYNEVVAYRLEKIGGDATGDANTQKTIQNFWFLNIESVEDFKFHDNQVSYGEKYTYNVYKYVFIGGMEYAYDNLVVSRTIADLDLDDVTTSSAWCLEMFDPETSEPIAPLLQSDNISDLGNTFASEAQINSTNRYVADINLFAKPSLKIVEVPIFTKSVTILDAPTNRTAVKPFYYLDNSKKIGFSNRYLQLLPDPFPTALNSIEEQYKQAFLSSYDLLDDEPITFDSVSLPSDMQIFRLEVRPQSLQDFDQQIIGTTSLRMESGDSFFADKTVVDKIKVNKKYYYLFRTINELGSPARSSQVLEAMLTDDGGYRFATFEVIFENELSEPIFSEPIKKVKKIFNIVPNIKNLILDDFDADYTQTAASQIQNINFGDKNSDLVWDKNYKIRVTSKKTGKKLDLNLTFKLDG